MFDLSVLVCGRQKKFKGSLTTFLSNQDLFLHIIV